MPHRLGLTPVVVLLLVAPLAAWAAELGRLTVRSIVGEPLNAEITVDAVLAAEMNSLQAKIADSEEYRRAQLAPIPQPDALQVAIEHTVGGGYLVRVHSSEPIHQPLINLLVDLSWSGGNVLRRYSYLLEEVNRGAFKTAVRRPERDASGGGARAPVRAATGATRTVQPGETLFKIARETQYEGVTLIQMIIAIHRANRAAFPGGNLNQLVAGRTLIIPGRDAAEAVPAQTTRTQPPHSSETSRNFNDIPNKTR